MSATYTLCKLLIKMGLVQGLQIKLDTFFAMERLTQEEYMELMSAASGASTPTQ